MKKIYLLLVVFISAIAHVQGQSTAKKLRVLVIGNSFSINATTYLPQIAEAQGVTIELKRAELGGCSLQRHWDIAETHELNKNDPMGKQYHGKSLRMLLSDGLFDVVTIQQYSLLSGDVNTYRPYAGKLADYVRSLQPAAKILVHQTWAYRSDAKSFGKIDGDVRAVSDHEMWSYSRAAYHRIAKEISASGVIPTGDAFWNVSSDPQWGFKKDTLDAARLKYPEVNNSPLSLHQGYIWKNDKLTKDYNHASKAGCYLGSLVWFGYLFNVSPSEVKFKPDDISAEFSVKLKNAAELALKNQGVVLNQ